MTRPWMQFYTRDWLDSKELRRCSPESRAVLADLMCLAHEGDPYGYLRDSVGPLTGEYMASRCSISLYKFRASLTDLVKNTRINQNESGFFISRMVRDEDVRKSRAAGGSMGGNPALKVAPKVNLPVNLSFVPEVGATLARSRAGASGSGSYTTFSENLKNQEPQNDELPQFGEWWAVWSKIRGTSSHQPAMQAWMSLSPDLASALECTRSYLASLTNAASGYRPDNFLFEQARSGFTARWPPNQRIKPSDSGTSEAELDEIYGEVGK